MKGIERTMTIGVPVDEAFRKFVDDVNEWWPKEYTWSQNELKEVRIGAGEEELCTEIGPNGFRCDWGTVTEMIANKRIGMKWQISPTRAPIPDPSKASDIRVEFESKGNSTTLRFTHFNWEKHGEGGDEYRKMMDSEQGWDYILIGFKRYCEK